MKRIPRFACNISGPSGALVSMPQYPRVSPCDFVSVAPGGVITQDFTTLITQVGWVLCIGRVTAFDGGTNTITFIYEPHAPSRFI